MIKFRIERSFTELGYNFWIINYQGNKAYIMKPTNLEFVECQDGSYLPDPSIKINEDLGTQLIRAIAEGLAESGLPIAKTPESTLSAKDENLNDLRRVIEKILK